MSKILYSTAAILVIIWGTTTLIYNVSPKIHLLLILALVLVVTQVLIGEDTSNNEMNKL